MGLDRKEMAPGYSLFDFRKGVNGSILVSNNFSLDKCCNLFSRELHVLFLLDGFKTQITDFFLYFLVLR